MWGSAGPLHWMRGALRCLPTQTPRRFCVSVEFAGFAQISVTLLSCHSCISHHLSLLILPQFCSSDPSFALGCAFLVPLCKARSVAEMVNSGREPGVCWMQSHLGSPAIVITSSGHQCPQLHNGSIWSSGSHRHSRDCRVRNAI